MSTHDVPLEPATAQRMEHNVLRQIRRDQLARRLLWLGTFGALGVVLTLVRPLLARAEPTEPIEPAQPGEAES